MKCRDRLEAPPVPTAARYEDVVEDARGRGPPSLEGRHEPVACCRYRGREGGITWRTAVPGQSAQPFGLNCCREGHCGVKCHERCLRSVDERRIDDVEHVRDQWGRGVTWERE